MNENLPRIHLQTTHTYIIWRIIVVAIKSKISPCDAYNYNLHIYIYALIIIVVVCETGKFSSGFDIVIVPHWPASEPHIHPSAAGVDGAANHL